MLDTLDDVDWGRLTHADGPATDVPGLTRMLTSEDAEQRKGALMDLWACLCHQGTISEATAHAIPFLLELLQSPSTLS